MIPMGALLKAMLINSGVHLHGTYSGTALQAGVDSIQARPGRDCRSPWRQHVLISTLPRCVGFWASAVEPLHAV